MIGVPLTNVDELFFDNFTIGVPLTNVDAFSLFIIKYLFLRKFHNQFIFKKLESIIISYFVNLNFYIVANVEESLVLVLLGDGKSLESSILEFCLSINNSVVDISLGSK